jgi:hypothetical protein
MLAERTDGAQFAPPSADRFASDSGVPEVHRDELSPDPLRAAILSPGCLLVRSLIDVDLAAGFREEMDRAFVARAAARHGGSADTGYFEEFIPMLVMTLACIEGWSATRTECGSRTHRR